MTKRSRKTTLLALVLLAAAVLAGCVGPSVDDASMASDADDDGNSTFPMQEHTLRVQYYARAASIDTQNMDATNWELPVPPNAAHVRVTALWEPSTPLARDQAIMLHEGTKREPGEMFGEPSVGASPIETNWTPIPEDSEMLVVMCHVFTSGPEQPVGVEFMQETRLIVEFS